jgi:uncharacterized sporulation protein YeaH/YhbH (DUF444 family)
MSGWVAGAVVVGSLVSANASKSAAKTQAAAATNATELQAAQYEQTRAARSNLAMGRIRDRADIYPVLRDLFAKKDKERTAA